MIRIWISLMLGMLQSVLYAQQLGFGFIGGIPQREFRESTTAEGFGLNFVALFPLGSEVVNAGFSLDYMIYGLNAQDQNLFADIKVGNTVIDRIFIPLRVVTTNSMLGFHGNLRVSAPGGSVQPYMEGLVGLRYISTSTRIEDRSDERFFTNDQDDNVIVRKTNLGDVVFSYGGAGGVQFKLNDNVFLDLRGTYLMGGRAKYYDGNDTKSWRVEFTDNPSNYDPDNLNSDDLDVGSNPKESTTDMLVVLLGISVKF